MKEIKQESFIERIRLNAVIKEFENSFINIADSYLLGR